MDAPKIEYKINEQGMVLQYLDRQDSTIKEVRAISSDNNQDKQSSEVREEASA